MLLSEPDELSVSNWNFDKVIGILLFRILGKQISHLSMYECFKDTLVCWLWLWIIFSLI